MKGACGEAAVTLIQANAGAGRSFVMEAAAGAHRHAGWRVITTALSWQASLVAAQILRVNHSEDAVALGPLLERTEKEPLSEPTLIVLDGVDQAPAQMVAALVAMAARADAPVKVLALGDPAGSYPGMSGLAALARNAPTFNISIDRRARPENEQVVFVEQAEAGSLPRPVVGELSVPAQHAEADGVGMTLDEGQKAARAVDPAILGRAFLQVLNDPTTHWNDRPFLEFSQAMAERAAELDAAQKRPGGPSGRRPGR